MKDRADFKFLLKTAITPVLTFMGVAISIMPILPSNVDLPDMTVQESNTFSNIPTTSYSTQTSTIILSTVKSSSKAQETPFATSVVSLSIQSTQPSAATGIYSYARYLD